jgi:serine/threonine protein kinase
MSSSSSHAPDNPESAPAQEDVLPFSGNLANLPDLFLTDNSPNTDNAPTVISKNHLPDPAAIKADASLISDLRGRKLAHFELLDPIGVGGMAAVLRACDTQLDRTVALKILPPDMAAESENVRRFHQEARAAAKLDHENIARVYFCGEDQRLHFIAFEYVEGDNLRTIVERHGPLPVKEAVHYMLQLAAGLAHANERGVVHRDIKPSNIIITPDGRAKLVDMGLARSLEPHSKDALTQSGVTLGTFDYISPEQALEPRDADVRSDIYSLGCTFYHALTGQPPVPEGTAAKKLHHHQHVLPLDPRQVNPAIPDTLTAILARMMAKDPKKRYQRPEHLVQHLLQLAQELGGSAEMPASMIYVDAALPVPPRKRPGLMIGLGLAGLIAAVLLLSFAPDDSDRRGSSPPPGNSSKPGDDMGPTFPDSKGKVAASQQKDAKDAVESAAALKKALAATEREEIPLTGNISLANGGQAVARGRTFTLAGPATTDPAQLPKLTLDCSPSGADAAGERAGVTVDGGKAVFRNIHFDMTAAHTPEVMRYAAVLVKNGADVTFERCVFMQDPHWGEFAGEKLPKAKAMTSVLIACNPKNGNDKATVRFKECLFGRGQHAVGVDGVADIHAENCAFGPHRAMFHLFGQSSSAASELKLTRCTALVSGGPVLRIDDESQCILSAYDSLFTHPGLVKETTGSSSINLIQQTDSVKPLVQFRTFRNNAYYKLNSFWVRTFKGANKGKLDDFQKEMNENRVDGVGSEEKFSDVWLEKNPLQSPDLFEQLATAPVLSKAKHAFQLDRALAGFDVGAGPYAPVGVVQCVWGETYSKDYFKVPDKIVVKSSEIFVDPALPEDSAKVGYFQTLEAAVAEAQKQNTIVRIKHNGLLPIQSIRLNKPGKAVTIQPADGYRPVLTLDSESAPADIINPTDAALFEVQRGQLILKNLAIHLEPDRKGFATQTVVSLYCQGQCKFDGCVVTLRLNKVKDVPLNAVTFSGPVTGGTDAKVPGPRVELTDSMVRGEGVFLNFAKDAAKGIPFDLESNNSLVLLGGSLVQTNINFPTKTLMPGKSNIKLSKCTFFTREPLLQLTNASSGSGLITTAILTNSCFFATEASPQPLIQFAGPNSANNIGQLYGWGGVHNVYCGYDTILHQSATSGGAALDIKIPGWQMKESMEAPEDQRTHFVDKTLDFLLIGDIQLADVRPEDVQKMVSHLHKQLNDNKGGVLLDTYGANLGGLKSALPLTAKPSVPSAPSLPEELSTIEQ